jgi:hypothetical protein
MAVSRIVPPGGANDFNLNITGTYTAVTLDAEKSAGSYSISSSGNDLTLDVYAFNAAGTNVGYTATKAFTATGNFNKLVVLGGTTGDVIGFTYKTTYTTENETSEVTAGPVITSISPSDAPNINSTIVVTGRNFASNVAVTFTSSNTAYTAQSAKNIVRSNATSLIVTRPDIMPIAYSPYTLTLSNPGVPDPIGTNSHILANSLTAGNAPVWVTGSYLNLTVNSSFSETLSATDPDGATIVNYAVQSGTLPAGLSLNTSTGAITGTPTSSNITVTFRATEPAGNFVDKAILFNGAPVWSTAAGALTKYAPGVPYTTTLVANDDNTAVSYSVISGALPTGLSLAGSTGIISGTSNVTGTASFTIRATDTYSNTSDRAFTLTNATPVVVSFTTVGTTTFTLPSTASPAVQYLVVAAGGGGGDGNAAGSGGGAGGMIEGSYSSLTPGSSYTVTVGGGGLGNGDGNQRLNTNGGNSVFNTATSYGGGGGASEYGNARGSNWRQGADGGSGGGGAGPNNTNSANSPGGATIGIVPAGATGYGNTGGSYNVNGGGNWGAGGGGGGAGGAGTQFSGGAQYGGRGPGRANSITGSSVTYAEGGAGCSGTSTGFTGTNGTANTGGGGFGTQDGTGGNGGSGIVVVKYFV